MPIYSARPIGNMDELKILGLDPNEWASCSPSVQGESVGCGQFPACEWRGPRPKYLGVEILKRVNGMTTIKNEVCACFEYNRLKTQIEANGGVVSIVAEEGQEITKGSYRRRVRDPLKPLESTSEYEEVTEKVPVFPLAGDREDLKHARRLVEKRQSRVRDDMLKRERDLLGTGPGLSPVTVGGDEARPEASGAGLGRQPLGGKGPKP